MAKKKIDGSQDPNSILKSHLDATKDSHFNYHKEMPMPRVSSGSLLVDLKLDGGFQPTIIRPVGNTQSGKTASTLEHLRNFLEDTTERRRAIYVKAEGRLSENKRDSSGVKFTMDHNKWEDGTCFILKTNIYENVVKIIESLINKENNDPYVRYWFVIDSMDGLISKEDKKKKFGEALKVAGGALMTSIFMKSFSLDMHELGHYLTMIGQMRSSGPQNQYAEKSQKVGSASGGNAMQHYSDWIFEYYPPSTFIYNDYSLEPKNKDEKPIGHYARFMIKKGDNEERNPMVEYPILYGRTGGSVFKELEVVDVGFLLDLFIKKGAWIKFDNGLIRHCTDNGVTLPEQVQGQKNLVHLIMENKDAFTHIYSYMKTILNSIK